MHRNALGHNGPKYSGKTSPRQLKGLWVYPVGETKGSFDRIMTKKGKKRASADVGLIRTASNLRRVIKHLARQALRKALLTLAPAFFRAKIGLWALSKAIFAKFSGMQSFINCLGKNRNGSHFLELRPVFGRGS